MGDVIEIGAVIGHNVLARSKIQMAYFPYYTWGSIWTLTFTTFHKQIDAAKQWSFSNGWDRVLLRFYKPFKRSIASEEDLYSRY